VNVHLLYRKSILYSATKTLASILFKLHVETASDLQLTVISVKDIFTFENTCKVAVETNVNRIFFSTIFFVKP